MTLDERARQAAHDLNSAVGESNLLLFEAGIPALRQTAVPARNRSRSFAFAGAFALMILVIGLTLAPGRMTSPEPEGSEVAGQGDAVTTTAAAPDASTASDVTPPSVGITSPVNGDEFTSDDFGDGSPGLLEFSGTAEPGSTVIARNGTEEEPSVVADAEGLWSISLILQSGTATYRFVAEDDAGNTSSPVEVTVTYTPDTASTTTTTVAPATGGPDEVGSDDEVPSSVANDSVFTASAAAGEAVGFPAADTFSGTAEPGSIITVTSEFGSGETVTGPDGQWEVEVSFVGATAEEPFLVTVAADSSSDARVKLEFVVRSNT